VSRLKAELINLSSSFEGAEPKINSTTRRRPIGLTYSSSTVFSFPSFVMAARGIADSAAALHIAQQAK
jgi:hypothetical protein